MGLAQQPLIGRSGEADTVRRWILSGASVAVEGPAGIGKTRLLHEVQSLLAGTPFHVESVAVTEASQSIPLGALARYLVGALPGAEGIARVQEALVERAHGSPLVIVVDDAHLLDDHSAVAMHQLVASEQALVLISLRVGAPVSSAVEALTSAGLSEWLRLRPLDEISVTTLAESTLGGPVDSRLAKDLWVASRGNPMIVALLVQAGIGRGAIVDDHGLWVARGTFGHEPRLLSLVTERLDEFSGIEREAMEILALAEPLEAAVISHLIPESVLASLHRNGLIVAVDGTSGAQVRLAHPLYGDAARQRLTDARRRSVMSALAETLDAADAQEAELVLRVALWGAAAKCPLAPDLLMRAAALVRLRSLESACHLLRAALAAGAGAPAALQLAEILMIAGETDEAEEALTDFDDERVGVADRVRACVMRAVSLVWTVQRPEAALAVLERERSRGLDDPRLIAMLDGAEAGARLIAGDVRAAQEVGVKALAIPELDGETSVLSATAVVVGRAYAGHPASASGLATSWIQVGERRVADQWVLAPLRAARWTALELCGELDQMAKESSEAFAKGVEDRDQFLSSRAAQALARASLYQARPQRAAHYLREVLVTLRGFDRMFTSWNLTLLAEALAVSGDASRARQVLLRADQQQEIAELFVPERMRAEAAVLAAEGNVSHATRVAAAGARRALELGMTAIAARCWFDAARFGHRNAARQLQVLTDVDGALAPLWRAHAAALVRRDGQALDTSARAFAALGARLYAAEAATEAALAHQRDGFPAKALASAEWGRSLLDPEDPVMTPSLRMVPTAGPVLTGREREVTALAAKGLANKEIAGRLEVSVRTVETHLARVYAKLGVSTRSDLVAVMEGLS
jgi:DNA-binding CsgD family transcriptional regulator